MFSTLFAGTVFAPSRSSIPFLLGDDYVRREVACMMDRGTVDGW